ncbi:MAG: 50S ribosomal protein L2 [Parachlamydiales bacterium]|nr:50S ribosomal protein L2 [Parachlamydiales bacterium]
MKKFRPVTPSQRELVLSSFDGLYPLKKGPKKSLTRKIKSHSGRNHHGHITCRHKGGGHKRIFREIDMRRDKENVPAKIVSVEYDPYRSGYIALLHYADGDKRYILAPQGIKIGDMVMTKDAPPYHVGNCMRLKSMPLGTVIHNIELRPGKGGKLVRSAGLSAQLVAIEEGMAVIQLPSKEVRRVDADCRATIGSVSNPEHNLRVEGKAGRRRWQGVRPTVRGTAMNPVDHPHGGGEGKSKGNHPQSPWGQYAKGYRTRSKKKSRKWIVQERRK